MSIFAFRMKKLFLTIVFSLVLMSAVSCGSARRLTRSGDGVEMTFVQITDTQVGMMDSNGSLAYSDSLMRVAVNAINRIRPACVINTGDLVNDFSSEAQKEVYSRNMARINPSIPVWTVPGNHDIRGYTVEKHDRYVEFVGYDRFSETIDGCAFIGFDSNCIKDGATAAEEEQFAWLKRELEKARGCRHIFVFCHCPIAMLGLDEPDGHNSFPKEKRARYVNLFKENGVEAVFSGHSHVGAFFEEDGIKHINSIPVNAAFVTGFSGINVVTVRADGIDFKWIRGEK